MGIRGGTGSTKTQQSHNTKRRSDVARRNRKGKRREEACLRVIRELIPLDDEVALLPCQKFGALLVNVTSLPAHADNRARRRSSSEDEGQLIISTPSDSPLDRLRGPRAARFGQRTTQELQDSVVKLEQIYDFKCWTGVNQLVPQNIVRDLSRHAYIRPRTMSVKLLPASHAVLVVRLPPTWRENYFLVKIVDRKDYETQVLHAISERGLLETCVIHLCVTHSPSKQRER